jgi:hypothetical protein
MSATILAIDLGKHKSVACAYRSGEEPPFRALASTPEAREDNTPLATPEEQVKEMAAQAR